MRTSMLMLAALCTTLAACRDDDPTRPPVRGPAVLATDVRGGAVGGIGGSGLTGCAQMRTPAGQSLSFPGPQVLSTVSIRATLPGYPFGLFNNMYMRLPNPRPCAGTQGREGETLTWEILPVQEISADTLPLDAPPGVDQQVWDAVGPRVQRVLHALANNIKATCGCDTSVGYILNELTSTWLSNKAFALTYAKDKINIAPGHDRISVAAEEIQGAFVLGAVYAKNLGDHWGLSNDEVLHWGRRFAEAYAQDSRQWSAYTVPLVRNLLGGISSQLANPHWSLDTHVQRAIAARQISSTVGDMLSPRNEFPAPPGPEF